MVERAGRARTRSADVPPRSRTSAVAMSVSEVFHRITSALGEAGIAYMLAGSFASAYYGAPRTTQDIDLVIAATAEQLRIFVQLLSKDEYYVDLDAALEARKQQSLFNVVDMATALSEQNHEVNPGVDCAEGSRYLQSFLGPGFEFHANQRDVGLTALSDLKKQLET